MSVSVIIGGQYGSEGKGKVALYWAQHTGASIAVRVGGSNSGHTIYDESGTKFVFRLLPTACMLSDVICVMPAGSYLETNLLMQEVENAGLSPDRLVIDPNAAIITEDAKLVERESGLRNAIGSTLSGVGSTVARRVMRDPHHPVRLARDESRLKSYLRDTKAFMREMINAGENIVIEGTQGYGLSNLHATDYPYATSRDTTAAGFLAETGLSPLDVEHIVLTIRAFPIRVAGNSGPLPDEIDWRTVSEESESSDSIIEHTTVTHCVRRVARFDASVVKGAIVANAPDVIVMNHVDYLDYENANSTRLTCPQIDFIRRVEESIERPVNYIGNGVNTILANK